MQGTAFYLAGAVLVIIGWTIVGMIVEVYGFWLLFCEFLPTVMSYAKRIPILNRALDVPMLSTVRVSHMELRLVLQCCSAAWFACIYLVLKPSYS